MPRALAKGPLAAPFNRRKRQSEEPDSAEVHFRGKSQEEFQV
jgi:hypothetical protein